MTNVPNFYKNIMQLIYFDWIWDKKIFIFLLLNNNFWGSNNNLGGSNNNNFGGNNNNNNKSSGTGFLSRSQKFSYGIYRVQKNECSKTAKILTMIHGKVNLHSLVIETTIIIGEIIAIKTIGEIITIIEIIIFGEITQQ